MKRNLLLLVAFTLLVSLLLACGDDESTQPQTGSAALYWAERPGDCSSTKIRTMDPDEAGVTDVVTLPGPDSIRDMAVDKDGGKIYFAFSGSSANNTNTVQRVNIDGSGPQTLATYTLGSLSPRGIALDLPRDHVYWLAGGGCSPCPGCGPCSEIHRADLAGSNPEAVGTLTGTNNVHPIALDPEAQKVYWGDIQYEPHIQRSSLDGTGTETIYTKPLGSGGGVGDIEIGSDGKLYWLESADMIGDPSEIRRSDLDGSSVETIVTVGGSQSTTPRGLAVDVVAGKIYWTESDFCGNPISGRIRRADLDGSNVETVVDQLGVLVAIELVR
jgi:hypothetical protein